MKSVPNSTQTNTRASRAHQILARQTLEHSECTQQWPDKHQSIQSASNSTKVNTRAFRVHQIVHRQTPEHPEVSTHYTCKHQSLQGEPIQSPPIVRRQTPERSELTKAYTCKHQSMQSAPNGTHANIRAFSVHHILRMQTRASAGL